MPVPHHSVFYRPDDLPAAQPTASKHWRHFGQLIVDQKSTKICRLWRHVQKWLKKQKILPKMALRSLNSPINTVWHRPKLKVSHGQFALTRSFPDILLTFPDIWSVPWQLSNSLTFPGFSENWSPSTWTGRLVTEKDKQHWRYRFINTDTDNSALMPTFPANWTSCFVLRLKRTRTAVLFKTSHFFQLYKIRQSSCRSRQFTSCVEYYCQLRLG